LLSATRQFVFQASEGALLARKFSFKGGIHPPHSKKKTEHLTIEQFPAPQKVIIPLSQHIGAPAKPLVKKGDRVLAGQLIGESSGFVSAVVHSSVSGTVQSVGPFPHPSGKQVISIEIENDGLNEMAEFSPLLKFRLQELLEWVVQVFQHM
jgi:electron transport complex protein RnfC